MPAHSESTGDKPKPVAAPVESAPKILPVMEPVPIMGESITQGVLVSWIAKKDLIVAADEVLGTIETDKVFNYFYIHFHFYFSFTFQWRNFSLIEICINTSSNAIFLSYLIDT